MNHAVVGADISLGYVRVIDHDLSALRPHGNRTALYRLDRTGLDIARHHFSWHNVIGQHGGELGFVLKERFKVGLKASLLADAQQSQGIPS